jgi:methyl-accepting chemotaxis protein
MSIKGKFRLIVGVAAIALALLSVTWLRSERARILAEKKQTATGLVEAAYSIVADLQKDEIAGKMTRQEAQKRALQALRVVRYGDGNYVWVHNMRSVLIMHPVQPQLDGKDMTNYRDPTGKAFLLEMTTVVRQRGAGYVSYMWPKPGLNHKPVPKISYVKGFAPHLPGRCGGRMAFERTESGGAGNGVRDHPDLPLDSHFAFDFRPPGPRGRAHDRNCPEAGRLSGPNPDSE